MEAVPSSAVGDLRGRVPARDRSGSQHRARELGPGRQDGVLVDVRHDHRADGMVWGILGLAIHMVGAVSLRLRARREYFVDTPAKWLRDWPRRAREICALEFVPAVAQRDFRMRVFPERQMYLALSWVLSTGIVFHVVFGTLLFSGLTFIGPKTPWPSWCAISSRFSSAASSSCMGSPACASATSRRRGVRLWGFARHLRRSIGLWRECLFSPYC